MRIAGTIGEPRPSATCSTRERDLIVIVLGVILIIVGILLSIPIIYTIGIILAVIGLVLTLLGALGRGVGGRKTYF